MLALWCIANIEKWCIKREADIHLTNKDIYTHAYMYVLYVYAAVQKVLARSPNASKNNVNKEFIMMTKFTIHVQGQCSLFFQNSQLSYFACLRSRQIIVLVSVLLEFAEQSQFLYRVSVDFGSRLLSMVPLSKTFHNVVIFLLQ